MRRRRRTVGGIPSTWGGSAPTTTRGPWPPGSGHSPFALSVAAAFLLAIWERGDLGNCTIRQAALVGLVGHLERFDTMRIGFFCLVAIGGFFGTGLWVAGGPQAKDAPVSEGSSREADREAILQSARDFTAAFEKGDAKAVAALWTEQGEL